MYWMYRLINYPFDSLLPLSMTWCVRPFASDLHKQCTQHPQDNLYIYHRQIASRVLKLTMASIFWGTAQPKLVLLCPRLKGPCCLLRQGIEQDRCLCVLYGVCSWETSILMSMFRHFPFWLPMPMKDFSCEKRIFPALKKCVFLSEMKQKIK
jgi:hypothetical protein